MLASPSFSPQLFAILRGLIEEKTGIHHNEIDKDVLLAKLGPRAEEAGFSSLLDYYYYLRYDPAGPAEMEALIEHVVVRETYLFREGDQLRTVVDQMLAPRARQGRALRIWSAACSTGEEPVTLAVLLAESGVLERVEIVASDISAHALAVAQRGRFQRRSLRALPDITRHEPWLRPAGDGSLVADPRLLARVQWRQVNLIDPAAVAAQGKFDAILCRNVLIYFSEPTTRKVVDGLSGALREDGVLLVSVTESLLRFGTALVCDEIHGVFMYRKAER